MTNLTVLEAQEVNVWYRDFVICLFLSIVIQIAKWDLMADHQPRRQTGQQAQCTPEGPVPG